MFRHIVCMKFADFASSPIVKEKLCALKGTIEELRECQCGIDQLHTERSYDLVWITDFDDEAAYRRYAEHPAHKRVQEYIHAVRENSVAIDYYI